MTILPSSILRCVSDVFPASITRAMIYETSLNLCQTAQSRICGMQSFEVYLLQRSWTISVLNATKISRVGVRDALKSHFGNFLPAPRKFHETASGEMLQMPGDLFVLLYDAQCKLVILVRHLWAFLLTSIFVSGRRMPWLADGRPILRPRRDARLKWDTLYL